MPFLNFGGNKNKHFNLSDMNFFMKNMKNRYSDPLFPNVDPDPLFPNVNTRIRIHYYGKVDLDLLFPNVDPRIGSGSTSK